VIGTWLLPALPLLALIIPLIFGCFPGESVIERLAARAPARSCRQSRGGAARPRPVSLGSLLRARLLIAASFAERPPPAALLAS
jgi:hypothetical protein